MSDPRQPVPRFARDIGWLVAIGLTGAAVRLLYAWQYTRAAARPLSLGRRGILLVLGSGDLRGGWWPVRPFYQDPLYPYWLACLMGVVGIGRGRTADGLGGPGGDHAARRLLGGPDRPGAKRRIARRVGDRTLCSVDIRRRLARKRRPGCALYRRRAGVNRVRGKLWPSDALPATAGAAWGVVGLLRSNALVIAPVAAGWLLLARSGQPGHGFWRRLRLASIFLAGFAFVILPVVAH